MSFNQFRSLSGRPGAEWGSTQPIRHFASLFAASVLALAVALTAAITLASPAAAQDETSTVQLGGSSCTGDNVEVVTETTSGEELITTNATPDDDGTWMVAIALPALPEAIIAWATCFSGDVAVVDYSPISLRVQPGVDVGGVIELAAVPIEGAQDEPADDTGMEANDEEDTAPSETIEELPNTGPFSVPLTALSLSLIAGGMGLAFVSRQRSLAPVKNWPRSHWDS